MFTEDLFSPVSMGVVSDAEVFAALPQRPDSFLYQFVTNGYLRLPTPAIAQTALALSLLSSLCPLGYVIDDNVFSTKTFPNLYALIVAPSGTQKTNAIKIFYEILATMAPGVLGPDPGSEEKLIEGLTKQPIQLLVYSEFASWLQNTGGAKDNYRRAIKEQVVNLHDCMAQPRAKMKSALPLIDYRLSLIGACTPSHIETHTTVPDYEQGFMSRFFFAFGEGSTDREIVAFDPTPENLYRSAWLMSWVQAVMADRHVAPCAGWDDGVREQWLTWQRTWRSAHRDLGSRFEGIVSRVPMFAAKIMMILAFDWGYIRGSTPWLISEELVTSAIRIARLHAKGALLAAKTAAPNARARVMREVCASIPLDSWAPVGMILDRNPGMLLREVKEILETLKARCMVEEVLKGGILNRGRSEGGVLFYRRTAEARLPRIEDFAEPAPVEGMVFPFSVAH